MLEHLSVKNLSVIEKTSLEFSKGLNIITGETGAGKSVLVGALKFLMGERFNKSILRNADEAVAVEAVFRNLLHINNELKDVFDIDDEVILSRTADKDGKNKISINSNSSTVQKLKEISEYLMDIHGQHEHQILFDSKRHLALIDFYLPESIIARYHDSYKKYKQKLDEVDRLKRDIAESERLRSSYQFDINEIDSLNLNIEEDSVIDDKITFLSSIEKIKQATATAIDCLIEGEVSANDLLSKAIKSLSSISKLSPDLVKAYDGLESASIMIKTAVDDIEKVFDMQNFSDEEMNRLVDRKFKLSNLYKRYGNDIQLILDRSELLKEKLNTLNSSDEVLAKLMKELSSFEDIAKKDAELLNSTRQDLSNELSEKVVDILKQLELASVRFEVRFTFLDKLDINGGVTAEFYISTNKGFELAPLSTVASGGEVSRVMLALKEVFADSDKVETLLFDEIDTGISGKAALAVAKKLKALSKKKQLIVITHLPVVAAHSDAHFHITKDNKEERTTTAIAKLDDKNKRDIIAVMISGELTDTSRTQADELIRSE